MLLSFISIPVYSLIQEVTASKHEDRKHEDIWIHFQQYLAPELLTKSEVLNSEGYS